MGKLNWYLLHEVFAYARSVVTDTIVWKTGEFYSLYGRLKSFYILPPTQPEHRQHETVRFSRHKAATFKYIHEIRSFKYGIIWN